MVVNNYMNYVMRVTAFGSCQQSCLLRNSVDTPYLAVSE